MNGTDHRPVIDELAASEGVFTTAQAARLGVPRNTIAKACAAGKLVRVAHGAYRSAATQTSPLDNAMAAWKLTAPQKMFHERARVADWDGITVGGATAAAILGIGDFHLSPCRILAPKRISSRKADVSFVVRKVDREDVAFENGLPVTKAERTLVDLLLDNEDPSLIRDAYLDAMHAKLDRKKLGRLVEAECSSVKQMAAAVVFGEE